jgi:hypothetical protein
MTEKELYALLVSTINDGLEAQSITARVQQADQPTTQGVSTGPLVTLNNVSMRRYGFLGRTDTYDDDVMTHTETQTFRTTFQCGTLYPQLVTDTTGPTANDLLQTVAGILQSDATIQAFVAVGVGIERIADIRQPYFTDDMKRFEASPSFDFTLTYSNSIVTTVPFTDDVKPGIFAI